MVAQGMGRASKRHTGLGWRCCQHSHASVFHCQSSRHAAESIGLIQQQQAQRQTRDHGTKAGRREEKKKKRMKTTPAHVLCTRASFSFTVWLTLLCATTHLQHIVPGSSGIHAAIVHCTITHIISISISISISIIFSACCWHCGL